MLEVIAYIFGFLIGVHLTITLFGALYRVIDLAYCLADHWLDIAARISLNIAIIFLLYSLISGPFITGFFVGQIFFAVFHVAIFWIGQLTIYLLRRS